MHYQQSDLDLMKKEVDEFGVDALLSPEGLKLLIADLEEARAKIAELRADKARLDWLEQQPSRYEWVVTLAHGCVFVTRNKTTGHPSVRAAIDAAMKAAQ